ncbi:MAG: glycoside hydrolase family 38 C-terminal domain-containing protein [Candidatus Neomarinimicrobiota bacterium]
MKNNLYCVPVYNPYHHLPYSEQEVIDELFDNLLNDLQKEDSQQIYHIGQMVFPLLGFLKRYPEKTDTVRKLIDQKKLFIGPFYLQLHSGHSSGEVLVRNLLLGHQAGKQLGDIMKAGFLTAIRGRNSQVPQILIGFNIDAVLIGFDVNLTGKKTTEFIWEGIDGSKLTVGRAAFITPEQITAPKSRIKDMLQEYIDSKCALKIFVNQFSDNDGLESLPDLVNKLSSVFNSDITVESIPECIWNLKDAIDLRESSEFRGEICLEEIDPTAETQYDYFLRHSVRIGSANHRLENQIQYVIEPWSLVTNYLNVNPHPLVAEQLWAQLLKNQTFTYLVDDRPEMFVQSVESELKRLVNQTEEQLHQIIDAIINNISLEEESARYYYFTVINSLCINRSEIVEIVLDLPTMLNRDTISAREVGGREIPFRIINREEGALFKRDYSAKSRYHCLVDLKNIPGMGWKTFQIDLNGKPRPFSAIPISAEHNALENDYLRVGINDNGTLEVFAKETGAFFSEVAYFVDEVDLGQFINVDKTGSHIPLTTKKLNPQIKLIFNSPKAAAYKIEYFWEVPRMFSWSHSRRSPKHEWIKITEIVSLDRLSRQVDLKIEIHDHACDHMIKICFPIEFVPENTYTDGFFSIETRSFSNQDQRRCQTMSMGNFVGVSNDEGGFAVLSDGINEYQISKSKHSLLALTLVRNFRITRVENASEEETQRDEKSECHLTFYPHLANWETGEILTESLQLNTPLIIRQLSSTTGNLPVKMQFLKVSPDSLIFSALKSVEDNSGVVLRLFNPTRNLIDGEVSTHFPIKAARYLSLEEHIIGPIEPIDEHRLNFKVFPKKIVTIKIIFNR